MSRATAIVISALNVVLALVGGVIVITSDDLSSILVGDLFMCVAALLAVPLLHYWIEGRS